MGSLHGRWFFLTLLLFPICSCFHLYLFEYYKIRLLLFWSFSFANLCAVLWTCFEQFLKKIGIPVVSSFTSVCILRESTTRYVLVIAFFLSLVVPLPIIIKNYRFKILFFKVCIFQQNVYHRLLHLKLENKGLVEETRGSIHSY